MSLCGVHSFSEVIVEALNLALELNVTAYDAAFLVLAQKLNLQFLTLDEELVKRLEDTKYNGLAKCPDKQ